MNLFQNIFLILSIVLVVGILIKLYLRSICGICRSKRRMDGKIVIITGGTAGIGFETAKDLARRGAQIILPCRDLKKGEAAADKIRRSTQKRNESSGRRIILVKYLDLTKLSSVRRFAKEIHDEFGYIDVLINNAGMALLKKQVTEDGLEAHIAGNHLGPFLLTNLLLDLLKNCPTADARIVNVSSSAHNFVSSLDIENLNSEKSYNPKTIYGMTKLCNILFTMELHRKLEEEVRLRDNRITVNALHPGIVKTELYRDVEKIVIYKWIIKIASLFFKTAWEGAQTIIYLAVSEEMSGISGLYWVDCKNALTSKLAEDKELAKKVWQRSVELVKLNSKETIFRL